MRSYIISNDAVNHRCCPGRSRTSIQQIVLGIRGFFIHCIVAHYPFTILYDIIVEAVWLALTSPLAHIFEPRWEGSVGDVVCRGVADRGRGVARDTL